LPVLAPTPPPPPPPPVVKPEVKEVPKAVVAKPAVVKPEPAKEAIALKIDKKKELKKQQDLFEKALLADIKKQAVKQKKLSEKQLKEQFEKTMRDHAEKTMRQQLLNEDIKLKGIETRQAQGEVNKYKALIVQAISERWVVPPQANKKLYCELMIRLAPGGMVLDVQVSRSSGDPSLDGSARAAVIKASPLPVPKDSVAFDAFRQFVLKVKPENVLNSDI